MVGHGGSSAGSYLADATSPIPSHCASIVATSTVRVNGDEVVQSGVIRPDAGTTSPMPDHKGFKLQYLVNFQKFSTVRVNCVLQCAEHVGMSVYKCAHIYVVIDEE